MTTSGARAGLPLVARALATITADTSASGVSRPTGGLVTCTVHPRDLRYPASIRLPAEDDALTDPALGRRGRSA